MQGLSARLRYLLTSTKGLVLLAIALVALVTAIWGTLSGPLAEWGIKEITVRVLGMRLLEAEREGRIITLYHSIAFAIVAVLVYLITGSVKMTKNQQAMINGTITVGYLTATISGLIFGYFGHNFFWHGLYVGGMVLIGFAGCHLAVALWPWRNEYLVTDRDYAHTKKGWDLERVAFWVMAMATLGSAALGGIAGMYYGNSFQSFLAEDLVREPHKSFLQKAVVGHLHIMLTLIAIATALMVGRWLDFRGTLHKLAMPLMILGTITISLGAWSVVAIPWAHTIIYVGSVGCMLAALFLVIFGWSKQMREGLALKGLSVEQATFGQKAAALLHDPLKFGATWQMVYMNFVVSDIGIFMAIKLDEVFRVWPHREERISLTGHWHILSTLIATILLFYFADMAGLKGKARQLFGWVIILGSDLAFAGVMIFMIKRLFVTEYAQQRLVGAVLVLADAGLAAVLVALASFLLWRLADLFKPKGRWRHDLEETAEEVAE